MKKKILKIMGDYSSTGLWDGKYGSMVDLDELNIPLSLKNRILKWSKNWDKMFFNIDVNENETFDNFRNEKYKFFHSKKFRDNYFEQKIISKLLKKYLSDKYDIYFFDEYKLFIGNGKIKYLYKI